MSLLKPRSNSQGKEAELANVQSELKETKDSLQVYKDAEQKAREAEILVVVDAAIEAGKIEASAKDAWVTMAQSNFDTVKSHSCINPGTRENHRGNR